MDWSKKVSKKYVGKEMAQEIHDKAAPFIKWLQEAEEEDSSEEEEELEIEYDDRHIAAGLKEVKEVKEASPSNGKGTKTNGALNANDEDDLDIDAI